MSEAFDDTTYVDRRIAPQPLLRFTPDAQLTEYLHRFFRPEIIQSMGRQGLFLYADNAIETSGQHVRATQRRGGTESPELVAIDRTLRQYGAMHSRLAKRLQPKALPAETPGVSLHLDVILHEQVAAGILRHIDVNPDRSIGAHISISRNHLLGRQAFQAACHGLYESLFDPRPPGIEAVELRRTVDRTY